MIIIDFQTDVHKLTKDELGGALHLKQKEIQKMKKQDLVDKFITAYNDELSKRRIYKEYSHHFSLHPIKVQELLNITSTERKRWTSQEKLPVASYDSFVKWGKRIQYPLYDAYELSKISNETIEKWRDEYKRNVRKNRVKAVRKSLETRKKNQSIQRDFYEKEWKELLIKWFKEDGELGATLQLSFWTVWLSRWAKEFQSKSFRARKKGDEYNLKKEKFYNLKNTAMELLMRSPYTELVFYRPDRPHKISNLHFCHHHFDQWCNLREFDYLGKWDYFEMYQKEIMKCNECSFGRVNDYYSLYFLSVKSEKLKDFHFSFHIPYPIGKKIFPPKHKLEKVFHNEQEGMFRFGRTLFEEEKIIFTEKEVIKHFEEAREKFLLYFS